MLATLAEGHVGFDKTRFGAQVQVFEELLELVLYGAMVVAQWRLALSLALRAAPAPRQPARLAAMPTERGGDGLRT